MPNIQLHNNNFKNTASSILRFLSSYIFTPRNKNQLYSKSTGYTQLYIILWKKYKEITKLFFEIIGFFRGGGV